ncbi:MAG TPA: methyltransferase domain-containing protein [Steroidobacteraceae bacterium]|nr:methyltransferase domain-containing protein [Steroidobacteraceae bacterium]
MDLKRLVRASSYANYNRLSTRRYSKLSTAAIIAAGTLEAWSSAAKPKSDAGVECNICHWRGRRFIDFHTGYGHVYRDSVCPSCFSHPRHRSYAFVMEEIFSRATRSLKVLHFAPEPQITRLLRGQPSVEYLSVDIDPLRAMRREDICNLSFKDNSFDAIVCIHVLEHIDDDKRAMSELYRVLTPNGVALLDVPIDWSRERTYEDPSITSPEERTKAFWQWDHVRLYGRDYPNKLRAAGFVVEEKQYIQNLGANRAQRFGLEVMPSFVCTKRAAAD